MNALNRFNLSFDQSLVELTGRLLPPPAVKFKDDQEISNTPSWENAFKDKKRMYTSISLKNWAFIYPPGFEAQRFIRQLQQVAGNMGFRIENPQCRQLNSDRITSYTEEIRKCVDPQLIFCVLRKHKVDTYSAIKKECVDRELPSQVAIENKLSKGMSVTTKVAVQLNAKLGGIPW